MSVVGLVLSTLAVSLLGGLVPVLNVELWLIGVSTLCPSGALLPVVLAASLGQVGAKAALYHGGDAAIPRLQCRAPRVLAAVRALGDRGPLGGGVVFASALTGLPPLYVVSVSAGLARFPFPAFVGLTLCGRVLRFALVLGLPRTLLG